MAHRLNPTGLKTKKVLIVDDHPLIREGLALRISSQPDLEVCGEATSADEALQQVKATQPDLAIIDIQLVESSGIELIKELQTRFPRVKTLVVSAYDDSLYAERALRAGALGYINKRHCQQQIIEAVRAVLDGRRYVSDEMTQRLFSMAVTGGDPTQADPMQRLSDRELTPTHGPLQTLAAPGANYSRWVMNQSFRNLRE